MTFQSTKHPLAVASVIIHPENDTYELFCLDCSPLDRPGAQSPVDAFQLVQLRDLGLIGPRCSNCGKPVQECFTPSKTLHKSS